MKVHVKKSVGSSRRIPTALGRAHMGDGATKRGHHEFEARLPLALR
ncbi:hypothetical protein AKJ09_01212 [Labilithrix luteola]|uniref:Uncharacterized protein n=1 Tax=Labilithrix luteola TaxID=1391654 RepID=A0A0K1PLY3_9BACT|nr:hypothetical protein AKJ09_01212 [Labilithrix luteola]